MKEEILRAFENLLTDSGVGSLILIISALKE